ncbi:MAG TPA: PKD domain-containing protein [Candidatus Paceibacterota bacterium]
MKTKWIVIIVIVVVIAGILGYVLWAPKTPTQTALPTTTSTSTTPSETYGMSQYTDPTYGFSFWYPSALLITTTTTNDSTDFPGGVAVETVQVGPTGGIAMYVVNSTSSMITDEPANHASPIAQTQYFYDSASGRWMVDYPQGTNGGGSAATTTANASKTTISGLVMLPSGRRFDTTIIPLSTTQFLVIGDGGGSSFTPQLAETVAEAGASINASTETGALQTEATAYDPNSTQNTSTSFSASPTSGAAPLSVRFTSSAPQGGTIGNTVSFGDGTGGNLGVVPTCSSCNALGIVSHTYVSAGVYTATLTSGACACPAGGICNCPNMQILGTATVTVNSTSATLYIHQLNTPGSVSLPPGGIAEVRNKSFYFTLQGLSSASLATIQITQVGCWNSFPSDPPPQVRCMIAVVPIPPRTLSVGQTYNAANYGITLTQVSNATATFSVSAPAAVQ